MAVGGPWCCSPSASNRIPGGVFPSAASLNGATIQSGSRFNGMTVVCPFATSVQVSVFFPKSLRDLHDEHTPLPSRQEVRWLTHVRTARLDAVVRSNRDVERLLLVSVEVADEQAVAAVGILVPALGRPDHALADSHAPDRAATAPEPGPQERSSTLRA